MIFNEQKDKSPFDQNTKEDIVGPRIAEPVDIFEENEALTYASHCDNPLTADYAIVAAEIGHTFGENGALPGGIIVEVCPGPGNLCGDLLAIGANHVIGIDGSPIMIAHATNKFRDEVESGKMEFKLARAQQLPLADTSVDGIVNFNSFHQFKNIDDAKIALGEMIRVIKEGGWGLIRDFRRGANPNLLDGRNTDPDIDMLLKQSLPAAFSKAEFADMLNDIGGVEFEVIDAPDPWRLREHICNRMRLDPVKHWMDAKVSQHVIFRKLIKETI